eukprot:CAMPEP_0118673598 /NCGR_PEP_ID=MMETSP0800-20121206/417_1 /TAXON_ID=210618 ORGANISM="Striatella unipunctata, Strain CCMP2910" /NCGR_SAMPLE_ID=MMETSP0800 /ASSEMBLY_ACC=CAM_ASM_000638 /LENGTH=61 /DNA_ID=CAMNT_0006568691 /DNA_START=251 /DNA_END=436 /DNA_ORIENTATION=-
MAQVDQDPPGPNSGIDAIRMPGPKRLPTAIPLTLPSFRFSETPSLMVVKSTWLKSLKECPV